MKELKENELKKWLMKILILFKNKTNNMLKLSCRDTLKYEETMKRKQNWFNTLFKWKLYLSAFGGHFVYV